MLFFRNHENNDMIGKKIFHLSQEEAISSLDKYSWEVANKSRGDKQLELQ